MKIIFFGTGEFSTTVLKGLIDAGREVVAVVTQTDKVNARNNKVVFSSIKQYCLNNNIPLHQFNKLNIEGEEILKKVKGSVFATCIEGKPFSSEKLMSLRTSFFPNFFLMLFTSKIDMI